MKHEHKDSHVKPEVIPVQMHHGIKEEDRIRGVSVRLLTIILVLVVVGVLAAASSQYYASLKPNDSTMLLSRTQLVAVFDKADRLANEGQGNAAIQLLQDNRNKVSNHDDEYELYVRLAQLLLDNNKPAEALRAATEATELKETAEAHALLADAAAANKDWALAAQSYGKAAELSEKTDDPTKNTPYNDYKAKQKEAEAQR